MAEIRSKSTLDSKPFVSGTKEMTGSVKGFSQQLGSLKGVIAGAFAGRALIQFASSVIQLGSKISDMATQLGLTTDEFQALEIAAINAGVNQNKLRKAIGTLNVSMAEAKRGVKTYSDLFDILGISQEKLNRLNTVEVLELVAKAMQGAAQGSQEFGAVLKLLGTGSAIQLQEVLTELADKGLAGMTAEAKEAGQIIDADLIQKLDKMADFTERAKRQFLVLGAEIGVKLVGALGVAQDGFSAFIETLAKTSFSLKDIVTGKFLFKLVEVSATIGPEFEKIRKQREEAAKTAAEEKKRSADQKKAASQESAAATIRRANELEVGKLRDTLNKKTQAARFAELSTSDKILVREGMIAELIREGLAGAQGSKERLTATIQILDIEREITSLTKRQAKEAADATKKRAKEEKDIGKAREQLLKIQKGEEIRVSREVSDRLARIGGFVGGAVSPEIGFAKRQLQIAQKQLEFAKKLPKEIAVKLQQLGVLA